MKKLTLTLITLTSSLLLSLQASAHTGKFVATDDYITTKICIAAAQNKPLKLHRILKTNRIKRHIAVSKIKCNEVDLLSFAERHQAHKVVAQLEGRTHRVNADIAKRR